MKEIYRIKNGELLSDNFKIPFDFGVISEDNGLLIFDFYISEDYNLTFNDGERLVFMNEIFSISAITVDKNEVIATNLSITTFAPRKFQISMKSIGHLLHKEIKEKIFKSDFVENDKISPEIIYYIELEGLKMNFSDKTQTEQFRDGVKVKSYNDWSTDHTIVNFSYNHPSYAYDTFKLTFYKNQYNNNIIVSFPTDKDDVRNVLHYAIFNEIKRDFISLLSLLNGAEVAIRKEYVGGTFKINVVSAQTVITYSFETIKNNNYSRYIPLSLHHNTNILDYTFRNCFNRYVEENKKLDLNSLIFYFNGLEESRRISEMIFILIIAFEQISKNYIKTLSTEDLYIISDDDFKPIKADLKETLKKHSLILGTNFERIFSKIGDINKTKSSSVEYKFIKLLEYAKIDVDEDIEMIIKQLRHSTIHEGNIGEDGEEINNYLILDKLLRDIILNVIGYSSLRNPPRLN